MRRGDIFILALFLITLASCLPFYYQAPPTCEEMYPRPTPIVIKESKVKATPQEISESSCEYEVDTLKYDLQICRDTIKNFQCYYYDED